jgi:hypothetical protein
MIAMKEALGKAEWSCLLGLAGAMSCAFFSHAEAGILADFPGLDRYRFKEKESPFYLGLGVSPAGFSERKFLVTFSPLQIHFRKSFVDWEILGASFGWSQPKSNYASSQYFVVRTVPKISFFQVLSVGPFVGYEGHLFRGVKARLRKENRYSPYERFSTSGLAWGAVVSQSFPMEGGKIFKINQILHQQRYKIREAGKGWRHEFERAELETGDTLPDLNAERVFALEVGVLF